MTAVLVFWMIGCNEPVSVPSHQLPGSTSQRVPPSLDDYVATPAGLYHRSCVHEIEDGARGNKNGLVTRKDGTTYQLPKCAYPPLRPAQREGTSAPINNGWIEDASYALPAGNQYRHLTANWAVPANPVATYTDYTNGGPPTYYAFPGIESNAFILQPVIQFGYNGDFGSPFGWVMASWHCDTGPGCQHSSPVSVTAGDAIAGDISASDCSGGQCTWTVTTQDVSTGQRTVMAWGDTEDYAWAAGGAVEVYRLKFCAQYPINGISFSGIALYDKNSNQVSPSWFPAIQSGTDPSCSFNTASTTTAVNLYHNPATVTASGGLTGYCSGQICSGPAPIAAITASGSAITVQDDYGHTGTITLSGATASGGLTGYCGTGGFCRPPVPIVAVTASGSNAITVTDYYGHTGTITVSGAIASGGLTGYCDGLCTAPVPIVSVTAQSNTVILQDQNRHNGYITLN